MDSLPHEAPPQDDKPFTFVLVHGAWHGGWCWDRVATLLRAKGYRVIAPTLSGLCERAHLINADINLSTHINDVVGEVTWKELKNIVLCGHSYGGMVITGVAERIADRIASIVYLDAFLPEDGQSLSDLAAANFPLGQTSIPPRTAAFFQVNEADRAWVDSKLTPQPVATFLEKAKVTGAIHRISKRTYVRATGFAAPHFDAAYEKAAKMPGWGSIGLASGHDVMLDQPEALVEILLNVS